jgi:hypothetical protein
MIILSHASSSALFASLFFMFCIFVMYLLLVLKSLCLHLFRHNFCSILKYNYYHDGCMQLFVLP